MNNYFITKPTMHKFIFVKKEMNELIMAKIKFLKNFMENF